MLSNKYINKLLKEKVKSMKQLDRIELNGNSQGFYAFLISSMIMFTFGFNLYLKSIVFEYYGIEKFIMLFKVLGIFSMVIGVVFLILGIFEAIILYNKGKKQEKENEEFLDEHS